MSRNGTDFGIRVSGTGDTWFTAPVEMPQGLYFPGFSEADANPDMGDSTIVETIGLGGFAMGAAPAVAGFVGAGAPSEARNFTRTMGEITVDENPEWTIPGMDYAGRAHRHRHLSGHGYRAGPHHQHRHRAPGARRRPGGRRRGARTHGLFPAGVGKFREKRGRDMTDTVINEVRRGFYLDSVALMRLSRAVSEREGVSEAALMMGTPANKQLMADAGLLQASGVEASGGDLVIGIRAADASTRSCALAQARDTLDRPRANGGDGSLLAAAFACRPPSRVLRNRTWR